MEQAAFIEKFKCAAGVSFREHLRELFADAFAADLVDQVRHGADRLKRLLVNLVLEARSETHRSQHPQLVLGKTEFGVTDGADNAGFKIAPPANVIEKLVLDRIIQQAID